MEQTTVDNVAIDNVFGSWVQEAGPPVLLVPESLIPDRGVAIDLDLFFDFVVRRKTFVAFSYEFLYARIGNFSLAHTKSPNLLESRTTAKLRSTRPSFPSQQLHIVVAGCLHLGLPSVLNNGLSRLEPTVVGVTLI